MAASSSPFQEGVPPELTREILRHVYNSSTRSNFSSTLTVCRAWSELATPLLWTDLALTNRTLGGFVKSLRQARNETAACIKSLTLNLNSEWRKALDATRSEPNRHRSGCAQMGTL